MTPNRYTSLATTARASVHKTRLTLRGSWRSPIFKDPPTAFSQLSPIHFSVLSATVSVRTSFKCSGKTSICSWQTAEESVKDSTTFKLEFVVSILWDNMDQSESMIFYNFSSILHFVSNRKRCSGALVRAKVAENRSIVCFIDHPCFYRSLPSEKWLNSALPRR